MSAVTAPRVLIVEDEFFIALDIDRQLTDAGFAVTGPAPSVAQALAAEPDCDVAVLDVNLGGGETSEPVADRLRQSGKAFVVLSGYSDTRLPWFGEAPMLSKPVAADDLIAAVNGCVDAAPRRP